MPVDSAVEHNETAPPKRRVPQQERSRRRVEGLLDAAARIVVERGVAALTTRDIAEAADAPVASLYQYFNDKEDLLLALAQRDMEEMDAQVAEDLGKLEVLSVAAARAHDDAGLRQRLPSPARLRGDLPARPHQPGRAPLRARAQPAGRREPARVRRRRRVWPVPT